MLLIFLNQSIAADVSLQWFTFVERLISFIILSRNVLLMSPISLFEGLNSLHLVFDLKFLLVIF